MLSPTQVKKRPHLFLQHLKESKPFYTCDGTAIRIVPHEVERCQQLLNDGLFHGKISLMGEDGIWWPLGSFIKTRDFGGQSVPPGQPDVECGKEFLLLKPSQIGLTEIDFTKETLYMAIVNNCVLQSTEYGQEVIRAAHCIVRGEQVQFGILGESITKAIGDYAGEYLGILAMAYSNGEFPRRTEFLRHLNCPMDKLIYRFPMGANASLADSFALVSDGTRQIAISSKGSNGGAAPSVSSLIVPSGMKEKYNVAVEFIELCRRKDVPRPSTISQVFLGMNLLFDYMPSLIPDEFHQFLPWDDSITAEVNDSLANGTLVERYSDLWKEGRFRGDPADGGKLAYVCKNAILGVINSGKLPEFQECVLEILSDDFIQVYTKMECGRMSFCVQWPAKKDGTISMESKSGAVAPTKGGFSFKLHQRIA